jgi:hypothetical protein
MRAGFLERDMLGRPILILLQLIICWFGAQAVLAYLPANFGADVRTMANAALFGVIAWVVGLIGSQALQQVALPSARTMAWAVIGGVIGGALVVLKVPNYIPLKFHPMFLPLGLAVLGYAIKR